MLSKRYCQYIICGLMIISMIAVGGCAGDGDGADKLLYLGSGNTGGEYYIVGGGVANILSDNMEGLTFRPETTGGSVDNINLLKRGEIDLGLVSASPAYLAYSGELSELDGEPQSNLRAISALYSGVFHIVVRKDSGIKNLEDFRGSKGSSGSVGSGQDVYFQHLMELVGIDYKERDDFTAVYADASTQNDMMKDGHIQWTFQPGGLPSGLIMELVTTLDVDLIPVEGELRDEYIEKHPYYAPAVIPGGTYAGFDEDIQSCGVPALLLCNDSLDEELVYEITKTMWESIDEIRAIHNCVKGLDLDQALNGVAIPLHPGAERYYKEVGLLD
jgi:TRAP transporter TAXI family solute receptor